MTLLLGQTPGQTISCILIDAARLSDHVTLNSAIWGKAKEFNETNQKAQRATYPSMVSSFYLYIEISRSVQTQIGQADLISNSHLDLIAFDYFRRYWTQVYSTVQLFAGTVSCPWMPYVCKFTHMNPLNYREIKIMTVCNHQAIIGSDFVMCKW